MFAVDKSAFQKMLFVDRNKNYLKSVPKLFKFFFTLVRTIDANHLLTPGQHLDNSFLSDIDNNLLHTFFELKVIFSSLDNPLLGVFINIKGALFGSTVDFFSTVKHSLAGGHNSSNMFQNLHSFFNTFIRIKVELVHL